MNETRPRILFEEAGRRGAEALMAERGGILPWCGPACIALAAGCSYAIACALLRGVAPERYAPEREIATTYWRDMVAALTEAGLSVAALPVEGRPTLLRLVRNGVEGDALPTGTYLVRITGHFLLLRVHGFGLAEVHDNRLSGAVLSTRAHGLCRVTHVARLEG
ncbi:hypothetical protein ACFOD4_08905 [Pseudoroseomonas globiformis]|uniref:Uncharacterized protein n=1 Tax=Teichococcus globiformis TaxID=2307229 RepID=A0ABV7FXQ5_9PROT